MSIVTRQMDAAEADARRRAATLSLYGGILIGLGKVVAYLVTDSTAVLSDALESTVNIVSAAFLVYSIKLATTPADENHPYGHGKVEFLSAGAEGMLIVVASVWIAIEAVRAILRGQEIHQIGLGIIIVGIFALANAGLGWHLIRVGRRVDSLALRADGMHLMTDVVTSFGVIVGLLLVKLTGWTWLDPVTALLVALNILRTGWSLSREAISGLMDEADDALLAEVTQTLESGRQSWCIDIHSLRAWHSGSERHMDFHLTVPRYFDAERLHEIDEILTEQAFRDESIPGDVIIHFDPCRPRHCPGCAMPDCAVRSRALQERAPLTVPDITRQDEDLDDGSPLG
jgi:cation diffusion facilitator family transporter